MPDRNRKHSAPTSTINEVPGWQTRLLYNYYGSWDTSTYVIHYPVQTGNDYTKNIFKEIKNYQIGTIPTYPIYKGGWAFPSGYFTSGKSIRVEGWLHVRATGGNRIFNIRASIDNPNAGVVPIAATNGFNNHTFAESNISERIPVYFKIVYTAIETVGDYLYMKATGHYQYEWKDPQSENGGLNNFPIYVPIHNGIGGYSVLVTTATNTANEIYISFDNSDVDDIWIGGITMEELS